MGKANNKLRSFPTGLTFDESMGNEVIMPIAGHPKFEARGKRHNTI